MTTPVPLLISAKTMNTHYELIGLTAFDTQKGKRE